ncbi:Ubiquitin carboxyl-terminal hydrolase 34 [Hondaea fermentalgiana]|uniref:Ubiquitin carboxyl-terminal hydrolase 34 n=1 Tax=Hondaea fermentalgiana TaxID=2315210 RepID=A0A2R5GHV8_9STRA|nr:Ubiquitin carboxyl-terminal hydrolase 34 [Hondaea fermentalgiana]|eukprot:GBG29919.1 Ubiquitin carboxyl-terminal hydrolase 34 [Hondaea fermentalgiana]
MGFSHEHIDASISTVSQEWPADHHNEVPLRPGSSASRRGSTFSALGCFDGAPLTLGSNFDPSLYIPPNATHAPSRSATDAESNFWAFAASVFSANEHAEQQQAPEEHFMRHHEVLSSSELTSPAAIPAPAPPVTTVQPSSHSSSSASSVSSSLEADLAHGATERGLASTSTHSAQERGGLAYQIFMRHVHFDEVRNTANASGIFSKPCFEEWLATRLSSLKNPYESFRRAVLAHVTGLDGRKPFPPAVESDILRNVRRSAIWPCFLERTLPNGRPVQVGVYGFRGQGYWEKHVAQYQLLFQQQQQQQQQQQLPTKQENVHGDAKETSPSPSPSHPRGPEVVPEAAKDGVVANPNHRELEAPDLGSDAEQTKKKARSAMDVDTPREYNDKIPRTLSQASNTRDANRNDAMNASDADEEEEEEDDEEDEGDEVEDDGELQDDIDDAEQMQDLLKNGRIALTSKTGAMAGRGAGVSRARRQDQTSMGTGANVRPLSGSDFEVQHANADGSGGGTDVEDNLSVAGVGSVGTPSQQDASPASLQDFAGNFFNENTAGSGMISRSSSVGSTHPSTDGKFVDPIIQALKESPISQNAFDGLRERMRFLLRFHLRLAKSKDTAQEQARARDAGESKTEGQAQRSDADGADEDKGNEDEDASILDEGEDARRDATSTAYLVRASVDTLLARCEALTDADVQNTLSFFTFTLEIYAQMFTAPLGEVHVAVLKLLSSGPRSPFFQLCGPVTLRRGQKLGFATVPFSTTSDAVASPPRASLGFLQLVEVFCDLGCLEAMVKELTHESPSPLFARHCVQVFSHIVDFLRPNLAGLLVKALVGALSVYLSGLSNSDLHRLDRSVLYEIFMQTHFLLNRTSIMSAQEARRCVEGLRLSVALKQLRSPFMQQRLAGLRQIRTIVEDAEFRASESARVQAAQALENKDSGARPLVSRKRSLEDIGSSVLRKRPNVGQLQITTDELMDSALHVAAAEASLHVGTRNNVGNLPSGTSEDETFFKSAIKSIFRSDTPHPQDEHDTADLAAEKLQQSPVPSTDSVADALTGLADSSRKSQKEMTAAKEADADAALAEALAGESSADRETLAIAARAFADSNTPFETLDRLCSKTQRILERVADKLKSRPDDAALDIISLSAATPVDMAATRQEPETPRDVAAAGKNEVAPNSAQFPSGQGAPTDVMTVNEEGQLPKTKLGSSQEFASGNEKVQSAGEVTKNSDNEELPDALPTSTSEKTATTTSLKLPPASDLATEALAIWFKENRVVQVIFGPDYIHTEVLKRCSEICRFLATQDLFSEEDLDLVWDTAFGTNAHESIRDTLCSILAELARYLRLDKLNYVWDKIKSIDLAAHDTKTLSLVRNFTVNAVISLRIHGDVNLTEAASAQNWYGLGLLWDMVQDETTFAVGRQGHTNAEDFRDEDMHEDKYECDIYDEEAEDFGHHDEMDVSNADAASRAVLKTNQGGSSASSSSTLGHVDKDISAATTLPNTVLPSDLEASGDASLPNHSRRSSLSSNAQGGGAFGTSFGKATEKGTENPLDSYKLMGKYSHLRGLRIRLNFLRFVVMSCGKESEDFQLTATQAEVILEHLGCKALTLNERSLALSWIMQMHFVANAFGPKTARTALLSTFRKFSLDSLRNRDFSFFEYFFRVVNADIGRLEYKPGSKPRPFNFTQATPRAFSGDASWLYNKSAKELRRCLSGPESMSGTPNSFKVVDAHLYGLGMLWCMALRADSGSVARRASKMLCTLFSSMAPGSDAERTLQEIKDPDERALVAQAWGDDATLTTSKAVSLSSSSKDDGAWGLIVGGFLREALAQLKQALVSRHSTASRRRVRCLVLLKDLQAACACPSLVERSHGARVERVNRAEGILDGETVELRIKEVSKSNAELSLQLAKVAPVAELRNSVAALLRKDPELLRFISSGREIKAPDKAEKGTISFQSGQVIYVVVRQAVSANPDDANAAATAKSDSLPSASQAATDVREAPKTVSPSAQHGASENGDSVLTQGESDEKNMAKDIGGLQRSRSASVETISTSATNPEAILQQPEHVQLLTELLFAGSLSDGVAAQTWDLLQDLPTRHDLLQSIRENSVPWDELCDLRPIHKTLYALQSMHFMLCCEDSGFSAILSDAVEPGMSVAWAQKAIVNGAASKLIQVLVSLNSEATSVLRTHPLGMYCVLEFLCVISRLLRAMSKAELLALLEVQGPALNEALLTAVRTVASTAPPDTATPSETSAPGAIGTAGRESKSLQERNKAVAHDVVMRALSLRLWICEASDLGYFGCSVDIVAQGTGAKAFSQDWLISCLLRCPDGSVKKDVATSLRGYPCQSQGLLQALASVLDATEQPECHNRSNEYFSLLCDVAKNALRAQDDRVKRGEGVSESIATSAEWAEELGGRLFSALRSHISTEKRTGATTFLDQTLCGLLDALEVLVSGAHLKTTLRKPESLVSFVFHECLFEIEMGNADGKPMCKSAMSRAAAFRLLLGAASSSANSLQELLRLIESQHKQTDLCPLTTHGLIEHANFPSSMRWLIEEESDDRQIRDRENQWQYEPASQRKAESGYVGLRNLGCICYMNSLLQQLYMIPEFRLAILRSGDTAKKRTRRARDSESVLMQQEEEERRGSVSELRDDNPDPDQGPKQQRVDAAGQKSGARDDVQQPKNPPLERSLSDEELIKHRQYKLLLRQTRRMFSWLQESQKRAYDMTCFCNESVSLNQGNPVDIFEQQDVDEFFNVLMDQLECGLKDTKRPNVLRELFGGVLCNQILCKEGCSHRSEREENFMVCQLEVKGKQSILESLDLYVEGEMLEGDNKYLCGECNEKRDAQKRAFFASLPNVFMIHLKRFDFDLELLRKIKVNDHCEFPLELNMKKYTREALEGRLEDSKPDSYYEYELVGILVHTGTADSGHYYSFIKERVPTADRTSCEWFHFNDEQVSHFDPATIPETSFGGAKNAQWDGNQQRAPSQSWSNKPYSAYMLIYERRGRPCLPGLEPGQARAEEVLPVLRKAVPSSLRRTCWQENLDYMSDEMVLDPAYGRFVVEACRLVTDGTEVSERNKLAALQACAAYCINTLVHAREKEHLDTLLDQLKRLVELGGPAATKAMLENFEANGATAIKQLLLRCPLPQVRDKFRSFVVQMLQENVEKEREGYEKSDVSIVGCWSTPHMEYDVELWRWRSMGELVQNDSLCLVQPLTLDRVGTLYSLGGPSLDELGEALWQHCLGIPCVPPVEAPSVRLIGWMLAHSTDAHQWWRAIDSFFAVLSAFADMGDLERTYMVRMGAIPRLLDFLLEHNSPSLRVLNRNPERDLESRRGMGDKFDSPTLLQAVRTLSTLVRACELPDGALDADGVDGVGGDGDSGAFVQREGVAGRVLTWLDVGLIFRTPFLVRLVDHHNSFWITDLQDILQHLGTGSTLLTSHIACAVRNMLFVAPAAAVEALLRTCEHLFNSDEARTISVAKNHALVLMESLLSPNLDCEALGLGVMHMSRLLSGASRFAVAQALFQHAPEWMLALLVDNESEVVRRETASMVLLMVAAFEERRELRASASEILREKHTVSSASASSSAPAKTIATATAGIQAGGVSTTSASAVSLSSTSKDKDDGNAVTSMDAASDGEGEEHETLGTLQLLLTLLSPSFMQTSCSKSAYEFIALRKRALPSVPLKPAIRRWEGPKKEPVDFHDTQGEEIVAHPGEPRSRAIARWAERLKETAKEPGPFTLVSALRTLLVLLKLCRGEPLKRFVGAAEIDVIVMAILAADAYKYECDWNKGELIAFLYEVTRGREDLLAQCAADPETTRAGALQMLDSLHHLKWAVRYYLLDVTEYVRTVAPLRLLVRASVPLLRDNSFAALSDLLQSALIGSVQEPMHRVGLDNVLLILRGLSGAAGLRAPGEPEDDAIASIYASRAHAAEAHATAIAEDLLVRGKATTVMLSTVLTHLRNISVEQYASADEKRAHMQYGLLVLRAVWARLRDARDLLAEQLSTTQVLLNDRREASLAANSAATNSTRMEDEDSSTAANPPAGATTRDATEAQLAKKMQGVEELEAASVSAWIQFILMSGEFHADEHVDLLEATSKCVLATVALAKKHARTLTNMAELGRAIGSCITRLMKRLQHGEVESKRLPAVYLDAITHSCEALLRAHYLDTEGSRNLPPLLMSVVSVLLLVAIEHRHSPSKHAEVATILERVAKRAPTDAWIRHNEQAELYINLLSSEPEAMQSLESYDEASRSILSRFRASLTSEDADGN